MVAQFYATLYVEEDERRMHWMLEGLWYSVDYDAFAALLGFSEEDLQRDRIHRAGTSSRVAGLHVPTRG